MTDGISVSPNSASLVAQAQGADVAKIKGAQVKASWQIAKDSYQLLGPDREQISTIDKVKTGLSLAKNLAGFFRSEMGKDFASGKGILNGASEFSGNVINMIKLYDAVHKIKSFGDVGALGQSKVLAEFQGELISTAAKQFGVNASDLSVEKVGEMAWNYLKTGSISGAAASGGAAAGAEVASEVGASASANVAGKVAGEAAGVASESGSMLATGGKLLSAAGAAYAGYSMIKDWGRSSPQMGAVQGATMGAYIGSVIPGVGTVIGGAVGAVVGGLLGCIHTGKSEDQRMRDMERKGLQSIGMVDKDWGVTLADGSKFDIGKDGKETLPNVDGSIRRMYEVDFKNPLAGEVVGMLNPLAEVLCGGNDKLKNQFCGYFTNAALSNAKDLESAKRNVLALYAHSGVSMQQIAGGLKELQAKGQVSNEELNAYANALGVVASIR